MLLRTARATKAEESARSILEVILTVRSPHEDSIHEPVAALRHVRLLRGVAHRIHERPTPGPARTVVQIETIENMLGDVSGEVEDLARWQRDPIPLASPRCF